MFLLHILTAAHYSVRLYFCSLVQSGEFPHLLFIRFYLYTNYHSVTGMFESFEDFLLDLP